MTALTIYGLTSCDTCRAAMKALSAAGMTYDFVDIRADADLAALAPQWIAAVGVDAIVNKRSTTWRGLSDAEKASAASDRGAAAMLLNHPTLAKRPVINFSGSIHIGWTPKVRGALGV